MLKRKYRLSAKTKIKNFNSFNSSYFILRFTENKLEHNRFGFIVSKKVDKKAVVRNRLKRSFRLCIENNFKEIKLGYDMLFILRREIIFLKPKELCVHINNFLKKEGFIK